MNLFARSRAQLNLSPGERAFLKLIEGFVVAGVVAALPIVAQLLAQQSVNWADVARLAGGTFAVAALMAAAKYYKAQGDIPLEETIALAAGKVAHATGTGMNDVKVLATPLPTIPTPPTNVTGSFTASTP